MNINNLKVFYIKNYQGKNLLIDKSIWKEILSVKWSFWFQYIEILHFSLIIQT